MKRHLLFSLIGAVIIFVWQFISFAMPNIHKSAMGYTPLQDEILQKFQELGLEEGMYVLGMPDPTTSMAQQQEAMKAYDGKPWALVNWRIHSN
jgi:hypothetical protein